MIFIRLNFHKMRGAFTFLNINDTLTAVSLLKAEAAISELKLLSHVFCQYSFISTSKAGKRLDVYSPAFY